MPIIGIDLGTTNSVVAVMDGREPRVLVNEEGQRITPSVVAFDPEGHAVVGAVARRQAITNPARTISSIKRFIGRRYDEVADDAARASYEVVAGPNGDAAVRIDETLISAPEIAARVLSKLRLAAEAALGASIDGAVLTVPAYFNDAQRQATRQAGTIAGLDVKRIVNEPTAAALAFGLESDAGEARTVVVFDLGGGTFDVSVLEIAEGVVEVRATAGDTQLGGDDMDHRIVSWLAETFREDTGVNVIDDRMAMQRLKDAAERAKIELSVVPQTEVNLPFLAAADDGPRHLKAALSRARFEQMIADLVARAVACCERVLSDAGLEASEVDEVVLVGGSTRVPLVAERVEAFFGRAPSRTVNPDEAVALGAAVQGAVLSGEHADILLLDVTPLTLGVETRGGIFTPLVERNSTIPTRARKTFSTAADDQMAIEVHVLQGERQLARDNRSLGRFELHDIPPMARGAAKIDVQFEIDANGIVSVSAVESTTGQKAGITISDAGGLEPDAVAAMVAEAEQSEKADTERRGLIERRNALESALLRLERRIDDAGADVAESTLPVATEAIGDVRSALAGEILDDARYVELNSALLDAAAQVEDDVLAASARRRARAADEASEPASVEPADA